MRVEQVLLWLLISLLLVAFNPTNCLPAGSSEPSPTNNQDSRFHEDFQKVVGKKRIVGATTSRVSTYDGHTHHPNLEHIPGSKNHEVATFFLHKPTDRALSPVKEGRPFKNTNNFAHVNHDQGYDVLHNTANGLLKEGYQYSGHQVASVTKDPSSRQSIPKFDVVSGNAPVKGRLISVALRDRTPSPQRPSTQASSTSPSRASKSRRSSPKPRWRP